MVSQTRKENDWLRKRRNGWGHKNSHARDSGDEIRQKRREGGAEVMRREKRRDEERERRSCFIDREYSDQFLFKMQVLNKKIDRYTLVQQNFVG